jgi:hypothetical protein
VRETNVQLLKQFQARLQTPIGFFFRQTRRVGHLGVGRQSWIRLVSALSRPSDTTNLDMELKSKNEKYYVDLGTGSVFCVIIPGPTSTVKPFC